MNLKYTGLRYRPAKQTSLLPMMENTEPTDTKDMRFVFLRRKVQIVLRKKKLVNICIEAQHKKISQTSVKEKQRFSQVSGNGAILF